jgi:hypothetical protein
MDAERVAVQVGRPGEVDVTADTTTETRAQHPICDFRRDWRRWSAVERICATLIGSLWVVGVATAILADAHLV